MRGPPGFEEQLHLRGPVFETRKMGGSFFTLRGVEISSDECCGGYSSTQEIEGRPEVLCTMRSPVRCSISRMKDSKPVSWLRRPTDELQLTLAGYLPLEAPIPGSAEHDGWCQVVHWCLLMLSNGSCQDWCDGPHQRQHDFQRCASEPQHGPGVRRARPREAGDRPRKRCYELT